MGLHKFYFLCWIFLFTAATAAPPASAGTPRGYRVVECPKVPAAYSQLINNLASLKSQLKADAHCEGAADLKSEIESLISIVGSDRRKEFISIISRNADQSVSAEEADKLRKYAEESTNTALKLMDMLKGRGKCFSGDGETKSLNTLTTVVNEATSLLAKVSGPYGVPIAIGGTVLTGVLQGIQQFRDSRPGFRFDQPSERQAYTEQLCVYHNYRRNLEEVMDPKLTLEGLARLALNIDERLNRIMQACTECAELAKLAPTGPDANGRLSADAERLRRAADAAFRSPLGTETVINLRDRVWADAEITRLNEEIIQNAILERGGRSIGPQEVLLLKEQLDGFFFEFQAPVFLEWQTQQAISADRSFRNSFASWALAASTKIAQRLKQSPAKFASAEEHLHFIVENRQQFSSAERAGLESEVLRSRDLFQLSWSAWGVVEEYCQFFTETRTLLGSLGNRFYGSRGGICLPESLAQNRALLAKGVGERYRIERLLSPSTWDTTPNSMGLDTLDLARAGAPKIAAAIPPRALAPNWRAALNADQQDWLKQTRKFEKK